MDIVLYLTKRFFVCIRVISERRVSDESPWFGIGAHFSFDLDLSSLESWFTLSIAWVLFKIVFFNWFAYGFLTSGRQLVYLHPVWWWDKYKRWKERKRRAAELLDNPPPPAYLPPRREGAFTPEDPLAPLTIVPKQDMFPYWAPAPGSNLCVQRLFLFQRDLLRLQKDLSREYVSDLSTVLYAIACRFSSEYSSGDERFLLAEYAESWPGRWRGRSFADGYLLPDPRPPREEWLMSIDKVAVAFTRWLSVMRDTASPLGNVGCYPNNIGATIEFYEEMKSSAGALFDYTREHHPTLVPLMLQSWDLTRKKAEIFNYLDARIAGLSALERSAASNPNTSHDGLLVPYGEYVAYLNYSLSRSYQPSADAKLIASLHELRFEQYSTLFAATPRRSTLLKKTARLTDEAHHRCKELDIRSPVPPSHERLLPSNIVPRSGWDTFTDAFIAVGKFLSSW